MPIEFTQLKDQPEPHLTCPKCYRTFRSMMRGMVQSLNVSVATATLLFEALRQRQAAGVAPHNGEGIPAEQYGDLLFEWAYPQVAAWCREQGRSYPALSGDGEILEDLPRTAKLRC